MIDLGQAPPQRSQKYRPPETPDDPVQAFLEAMRAFGLDPGDIEPSGALVRFDVDRHGDKAGWYIFFAGEIAAGAFGNWKTDVKENWCSKERRELSDDESAKYQEMVAEAKRQREHEKAELQEAARIKANHIWNDAEPASQSHSYLIRKNITAHGLKQSRGDLVVPVTDETGTIQNLQFIKPNGEKRFMFGGMVEGCFFTIPGSDQFYLCEGFATGATIHNATGGTVLCAFNNGNLPNVGAIVRKNCPVNSITVCADNDRFTAGNPGLKYARQTAKAISGQVVMPDFSGSPNGNDPEAKLTDFNDLAAIAGIETVANQIKAPGAKSKLPPLTAEGSRVSGRLRSRPKPLHFIFKYNDQGLIPKGVVGVLTATGGTGKTFWLLSLAMAGASGDNFGPINAPEAVNTLVIVGEDTQDELDRRLWDIGKGQFPDRLFAASVYGEIGPLMRLEGSTPVLADSYYWLEETIKNHPGLELLIIDPKSRFYGLDENNSEHATQWIQALEGLSKRHGLTILFSHHTSKENSAKISQNMSRGSSAIVDGCRWQGGLVRMDKKQADKYGIEHPRQYVIFDAPKANYGPDLPDAVIFKRGESGVLEYTEPWRNMTEEMAGVLLEMLRNDPTKYTRLDLTKEPSGKDIAKEMKGHFSNFKRSMHMGMAIDTLLRTERIFEIEDGKNGRGRKKMVLSATPF